MKKITKIFMSLSLVSMLLVAQVIHGVQALTVEDQIVSILFTNDVHGQLTHAYVKDHPGVYDKLGYGEVAGLKDYFSNNGHQVFLVDAGDALQGAADVALSKGVVADEIMTEMKYDFRAIGNHEFDYGMEHFLELAGTGKYYSANFIDLKTNKPVFDSYKILETDIGRIALVGITTPEAYTKSTPKYFQDDHGNYIYGLCEKNNGQDLYDAVQDAVDAARNDPNGKADYVIAVGHVGIDKQSEPWTSKDIIANTTGIDAFIDGHSHSTFKDTMKNMDGEDVLFAQTGTKLSNIGQLQIIKNDIKTEFDVELYSKDDFNDHGITANKVVQSFIDEKYAAIDEAKAVEIGESEILLNDSDENGKRLVRHTPTNLGDFSADAYRYIMGADLAFMNGGGIRASIQKGKVTYGDLINVYPFNNSGTLIEATGQQILDALEMSMSMWPEENGGYLHTSGVTYEFHSYLDSKVVKDDKGSFVKVDGEYRVKNVKINNEALDLKKTYKLASHDYMLKNGGDGYSMFVGSKILKDATIVDNEMLIQYFQENLNGKITEKQYGKVRESRVLVEKAPEKPVQPVEPPVEQPVNPKPDRPNTSDPYSYYTYGSMAIASLAAIGLLSKKRKHL